ncbi:MAG: hypothetical protein OXF03_06275 [Gammaproteobacteria bacterium]|nr:hypothetical protein [Gammaproteobacteria bacterium]MCY4255520.1 hypothetical protein [Gammaproteobacteria bacterium]
MNELLLSNDELDVLRSATKRVINPGARWAAKLGRHSQRNYIAESEEGVRYRVYLRQNLDDERDFSCGLAMIQKSGKPLSLIRYNGSSHRHGDIRYRCHIHRATSQALEASKKIDSHAEATDRYRTLEGALACLIEDCSVQGVTAKRDEPGLFDGS